MENPWVVTLEVAMLLLAYAAGWLLTLLGMPGTWLIVTAAALYAWLGPDAESRLALGWPLVATLLVLAVVGEVVETVAGAAGAKRAGGSRRGMLLAIVGSVVGALLGAGAGLPIPLIGPLLGALLGAAVGAFFGAAVGEIWKGRELEHTLRVSQSAFWGRLWGTLAKLGLATLMVIVGTAALVL